MALTAYCKKCGREVEPGEICARCGSRLGKNAAHAAWCVERLPVADWMCWNRVMRLLLPAALAVALLVLALEGLTGGIPAVEKLLTSGFPEVLGILLFTVLVLVLLVLLAQGRELTDYVVDNRGVHETRYLPNPTPLKLAARLKNPVLARGEEGAGGASVLKLGETDVPWKNVARVQLWPEKCMILIYAPAWWLRVPVYCTPFTWDDATGMIREKLGRKKNLLLPDTLRSPAPVRGSGARRPAPEAEEVIGQIRMEDLTAENLSAGEGTGREEPLTAPPEETGNA